MSCFQVIEFVQFKERLQRSSQYLLAKIEAPILHLKQNADSIEKEEVAPQHLACLELDYFAVSSYLSPILYPWVALLLFQSVLENLKCGSHFLELSSEIGSKSLTFNEDMQLRPWWTPTSDKNYLLGQLHICHM